MTRLPPLPDLDLSGPAPHARGHGDVYFSGEGLSEKREVFLKGCGLPERWSDRDLFTVGELGFGTGLNLLALWDLWRRHRPSSAARLHVLSFEGALIPRQTARVIHAAWPELGRLSEILLRQWPERALGFQRINLPDGVTLTLALGDIAGMLPEAHGHIDAWFLDGFAPSKNPEMWTSDVLGHVARLCAPGARASTYTVAGHVRRTLEEVGFAVSKEAGHGRKKERLEARFLTTRPLPASRPRRVAIIGAGVAGAWAARAFLDRGCDVAVHDSAAGPASGASGNPLALVMPRLDAADSPQARALIAAWLQARRAWHRCDAGVQELDAIHLPRDDREVKRFAKLLADPPLDDSLLRPEGSGLRHAGAVAIAPSVALPQLMAGASLKFGAAIASPDQLDADLVVICAGMGLAAFGAISPPLEGRLGQVETFTADNAASALADGGYVVSALGQTVFGATFEAASGQPETSDAARRHNLEIFARLRPGEATPTGLTSRAAIRATTPDRFPFAGLPVCANEKAPDGTPAPSGGLRLIGGLGSRGFLWAPLLAELVASEVCGEPWPVETSVAACLDPRRFHLRALRRGG